VWTGLVYFMLSTTLWQPRSVVAVEADLFGAEAARFSLSLSRQPWSKDNRSEH
jgi:hypothetical protein